MEVSSDRPQQVLVQRGHRSTRTRQYERSRTAAFCPVAKRLEQVERDNAEARSQKLYALFRRSRACRPFRCPPVRRLSPGRLDPQVAAERYRRRQAKREGPDRLAGAAAHAGALRDMPRPGAKAE